MTTADFAAHVAKIRCTSEVDDNGTIWLYTPPGHVFTGMDVHTLSMDTAACRPRRTPAMARACLAQESASGVEPCPDAACECHEPTP